ncbi:ThiF family adenylyltransferase [Halovulum sp. GXIMD14794]
MSLAQNEERLVRECEELSTLEGLSDWLQDGSFGQDSNGLVCWSFTLLTKDRRVPLRMVFPVLFPDLPPFVVPADDTIRLSQHQYGAGGELCLQYRSDNWHPDCKSTDVVRSAKALIEATPANDAISDVESAHPTDLPTVLAAYSLRFMLPPKTADLLRTRLAGRATELRLTVEHRWGTMETQVARIASIGHDQGLRVPVDGPGTGGKWVRGVLYRLPGIQNIPDLSAHDVEEQLFFLLPHWLRAWINKHESMLVVLSNGRQEVLFRVWHADNERKIDLFLTFAPPQAKERRVHGQTFRKSSVCIIGAGSLGSKVAASLAREGVGQFMLLDNDVLWTDNLVRNELDELDVGHHKAMSLQHRLLRINPSVLVSALGMSLTSQSTVQNIAKLSEIVSSCDLVVDTTADSGVFRMAAAICTQKRKPLVWARVYAGGIGGLVARSVPAEDPAPMIAAYQLQAWCDAKGEAPPEGQQRNYGLQEEGQEQPLFASDGDVGAIGSRLVRHALDVLSPPEMRIHPEPAYYIGLRKGWIFEHPFDTHPVVYSSNAGWGDEDAGDNSLSSEKVLDQLGGKHAP